MHAICMICVYNMYPPPPAPPPEDTGSVCAPPAYKYGMLLGVYMNKMKYTTHMCVVNRIYILCQHIY